MKKIAALLVILSLSGCTAAQQAQLNTITAGFIGAVQAGAASACKIIPTVATIETVVAAIYPPASVASASVNAVLTAICSAAPPKASARFQALPTQDQSFTPAVIGTTSKVVSGITVTGWRAGSSFR